jgi:hypothetical protein
MAKLLTTGNLPQRSAFASIRQRMASEALAKVFCFFFSKKKDFFFEKKKQETFAR